MYLTRTQTISSPSHLALYVVNDEGWLRDVASVEYRVLRPDGTEHTAWTEVVGTDGDGDTGTYWPDAWAAGGGESLGFWRIYWRWTDPDDSSETKTWSQKFEVVDEGLYSASPYRTYLGPAAVFAEGVLVTDVAYARLEKLILDAQDYIERATGQFFRPVPSEQRHGGRGVNVLHLRTPIIGLEYVRLGRSSTNTNEDLFDVGFTRADLDHHTPPMPDERKNPGIHARRDKSLDFFSRAGEDYGAHLPRFAEGRHNQRIKGVFGYVEQDGSTPALIQEAALRLVINKAPKIDFPGMEGGQPVPAGPTSQEMVDRHLVSFVKAPASKLQWALATDKRVEEILRMFKAPWLIGSPVNRRM